MIYALIEPFVISGLLVLVSIALLSAIYGIVSQFVAWLGGKNDSD